MKYRHTMTWRASERPSLIACAMPATRETTRSRASLGDEARKSTPSSHFKCSKHLQDAEGKDEDGSPCKKATKKEECHQRCSSRFDSSSALTLQALPALPAIADGSRRRREERSAEDKVERYCRGTDGGTPLIKVKRRKRKGIFNRINPAKRSRVSAGATPSKAKADNYADEDGEKEEEDDDDDDDDDEVEDEAEDEVEDDRSKEIPLRQMRRRGDDVDDGGTIIGWFCTTCTARNQLDAQRCSNVKCCLERKVVGLDMIDQSTVQVVGDAAAAGQVTSGAAPSSSSSSSSSSPPPPPRQWDATDEATWWTRPALLSNKRPAGGGPSPRERAQRKERVWRPLVPTGQLCVRSCTWADAHNFLRRMQSFGGGCDGHDAYLAPADDLHEFHIEYIIKQIGAMRHAPPPDTMHIQLQLQRGAGGCRDATKAPTGQVLGMIAGVAKLSRRVLAVEFTAIYVVPPLRGTSLPAALVRLAFADVAKQTEERRRAGGEEGMPWTDEAVDELTARVTLPHCMQTSASFWERLGFHLGRNVDAKEHKHAVLRSVDDLTSPEQPWSFRRCGAGE